MLKPVEGLHDGMTVEGNLDLTGRRDIVRLPDDLTVNGYLSCSGCINLQEVPKNLHVKDYLSLRKCRSLKAMAPVNVEGKIYIDPELIRRTPYDILPLLLGMHFSTVPMDMSVDVIIEKRLRGEP